MSQASSMISGRRKRAMKDFAPPDAQADVDGAKAETVAVRLYANGELSLSNAAQLAGQPLERFLTTLASAGVDAVSYPPSDLADELASFS